MKIWVLAGLFTVATVPFAAAAETDLECQLDDARRATQTRIDVDAAGGAAPPVARPSTAPREEAGRPTPRASAEARNNPVEGRRNGKRIPDAELIGPRGAL